MKYPKFGTAGAGDLFYNKGFKKSEEIPAFLSDMGLTAFEYQCGRGVKIGKEKANILGQEAKDFNISLSIHAPYYISLTTNDPEKLSKNLKYFTESAEAAHNMNAKRIVFHPGGLNKLSREEAFSLAKKQLEIIMSELKNQKYDDITFCPETMGKINQLGDLDETLNFCKINETMIPCIDFGHMNSRTFGQANSKEAFKQIFDKIENKLGKERAQSIHCHFSKIEYGKGGEIRHLTFEDTKFGPAYEPLIEYILEKGYTPTIICESAGTQAEDAQVMSKYYFKITKN